jgi:hypothetical protein
MGRKKKHESANERVRAHRELKKQTSSKKAYCNICEIYVQCTGARDEKEALRNHIKNSRTHKNLVSQGYPYWKPDEDDHESVVEMALDEDNNEVVVEMAFDERNAEPVPVDGMFDEGNIFAQNSEVVDLDFVQVAEHCKNMNEDFNVVDMNVGFDRSFDMGPHDEVEMVADSSVGISANREYVLVKSYLSYGRKSVFDVSDSPIFDVQRKLRVGFNNILKGTSPYAFSKVNNREVDWLTALEITKDYIDSNESIKFGDRRIKTMINGMKRETGKSGRLPKRIGTLVSAFCKDLDENCRISMWKGRFFDPYFDAKKKEEMKSNGVKWTHLKGSFIPIHCAIAQMLLRLNVEDFDSNVGPRFRNVTKQSGEVVNVRSYSSFSCSKYAIELQKQVNALCIDDICIPLVLCFAVWIDKAPLNSSMTRKATPVMIFLMNDKTRTPFRIGYAPDDFGNNQELLESLLRKQKVSKSKSAIVDLVKEYKRQGLIDYVTFLFDQFLEDVWNSKGMDVQVGTGEKSAYFRVFPVLSHFITDNITS